MRIRYQLLIGFLVVALSGTVSGLVVYNDLKELASYTKNIVDESVPELFHIDAMEDRLRQLRQRVNTTDWLLFEERQSYLSDYEETKVKIQELSKLLVLKDEEVGEFQEREEEETAERELVAEGVQLLIVHADDLKRAIAADDQLAIPELISLVRRDIRFLMRNLVSTRENELLELQQKQQETFSTAMRSNTLIVTSGILGIIVCSLLALFLARQFSTPIEAIAKSMKLYSAGDYDQEINVRAKNELGTLSLFINDTFKELNQHREILEAQIENKTVELRESEKRYKLISDNMTDLIAICDLTGKIKYVSPSIKETLGFDENEVLNRSVLDVIYHDDQAGVQSQMHQLTKKENSLKVECRLKKRSGDYLWVETLVKGVTDDDGKLVQIQTATRDITERKTAERVLVESLQKERELGRLKSKFVSMASHQFRTPLTVIQSNIELLNLQTHGMLNNSQGVSKFDKLFLRVQREVDRMTDMMNDVLVLGKLESGAMTKKTESVDLVELSEEFKDQSEFAEKGAHRLNVVVKGESVQINADRTQLGHALMNLISNAFKYSPEHVEDPCMVLDFTPENKVGISIIDQGIGIPASEVDQVFSPFYRAENVGEIPGTGLGLNIVKKYIELNAGSVAVESSQGKGTTINIFFPKPSE